MKNFIVFGLTQTEIVPTIYHIPDCLTQTEIVPTMYHIPDEYAIHYRGL
jgi:hypothetical protein